MPTLSIVIPIYNEEDVITQFYDRLQAVIGGLAVETEILFVNDGSKDHTLERLLELAKHDKRIKVLDLSRNFGHQIAITAGTDFAQGEAVIVMDGDLQDPPELIPLMLEKYRAGYHVVSPKRIHREGDSIYKRISARIFYRLTRRMTSIDLPEEIGDFRLMSRAVIEALRRMREQHRFIRGMVAWIGFNQTYIPFTREARIGGKSKYTFRKMLGFAFDAIFSFSPTPIRVVTAFGVLNILIGAIYLLYNLYKHFYLNLTVEGWTSLMSLQVCYSGALLVAVGTLGEYIARIFEESKQRPLYIVKQAINLDLSSPTDRTVVPSPE